MDDSLLALITRSVVSAGRFLALLAGRIAASGLVALLIWGVCRVVTLGRYPRASWRDVVSQPDQWEHMHLLAAALVAAIVAAVWWAN